MPGARGGEQMEAAVEAGCLDVLEREDRLRREDLACGSDRVLAVRVGKVRLIDNVPLIKEPV